MRLLYSVTLVTRWQLGQCSAATVTCRGSRSFVKTNSGPQIILQIGRWHGHDPHTAPLVTALSVYIWYWQPRPPAFSPPRPVLTATLHKTLIYCFIPVQTSGRQFYLYTLPVPLEKRKWVISLIIFCLTPHYHQFRVSILILPFERERGVHDGKFLTILMIYKT